MSFRYEITFLVPSFLGDEREFEITCEFSVTSWGESATMPSWNYAGDPGSGPEWEIDRIFLDGEEIPPSIGVEHTIDLVREFDKDDRFLEGPARTYGRFRERPVWNPLWEALAASCDTYINENYEFIPPEPDYD